MQRQHPHTQHGFISIEMMIGLIIIAIGIGLAVSRGAGLFGSSNISEEQSNLATLTTNTRALKGSNGYGTSGTNLVPSLIAVNGVPKNMSVVSGVLYNVYGGSVTVVSTGMGFTITSSSLPKDACIALATRAAKNEYEQTKINSGSAVSGEVTTVSATTACSSSANTITWTISS
ncbi:pilus assembly protein PilX [Pseudomonas sp. PIC25]|uniref:type 4 pilus major pilin n=1 Tax=Pseudomonas sp. PIC25 TaxID=1958773 RepID=UPI000BABEAB3|nr:type 4 pilus major pilin [Pseudomonas sp. PIC25]PAU63309.1 pilus assembly protein PilX [Pseudomonas sp. PIC25]